MSESTPRTPSKLSPSEKERFEQLQKKAKDFALRGFLNESLEAFKQAKRICPTKKVLSRIEKVEQALKENETAEDMVELVKGFFLYHELYERLYPYQKEGVTWMWNLYNKRKGGVLGDDMGLGKTIQVIAFLSGMIDANLISKILIIMPVSLLPNWKKEFKNWCPGIMLYEYHGTSKKEREQNLNRVQHRGGVLLTSYGMVVSNWEVMSNVDGRHFVWDYVILDEGHKIKNPSKTTKAVHEIPAKNRLVLTGTPIQNNLRELWALYDFTHHGTLLGSLQTFKNQYEHIITRSREKDCSLGERKLGAEMAQNLKKLIDPFFLRRTKSEVLENKAVKESSDIDNISEDFKKMQLSSLSRKNDFIIWLFLSEAQNEIYTSFLKSDAVKKIFVDKRSPLVELTTLKKICDHPRLLSQKACQQLGLNGEIDEQELEKQLEDEAACASSIENVSDDTLINESGKIKFTIQLLENIRTTGHRALVFSLSRKILDMIHRILTNRQWKVLRIDGTIAKMDERQRRVQLFQSDSSYTVFLLTTQVGGVGLTLTAADRVIIYDPSWNPATDAQAVDRAYRIGQSKNVVIYRLITCGTVEEKIYRRQIFKDSITRQTTSGNNDPHRYFSKQELRELFTVDDIYYSNTQVQLQRLHSGERKTDTSLDEHIAFLHSLNIFGISDHDLMFSKDIKDKSEDNDETHVSVDYIKRRVEMAQQMVQSESSVIEEGMRLAGSYVKPYTLPLPGKKTSNPDLYVPPQFPEIVDLTEKNTVKPINNFEASKNARLGIETDFVSSHIHTEDSPRTKDICVERYSLERSKDDVFLKNTSQNTEVLNEKNDTNDDAGSLVNLNKRHVKDEILASLITGSPLKSDTADAVFCEANEKFDNNSNYSDKENISESSLMKNDKTDKNNFEMSSSFRKEKSYCERMTDIQDNEDSYNIKNITAVKSTVNINKSVNAWLDQISTTPECATNVPVNKKNNSISTCLEENNFVKMKSPKRSNVYVPSPFDDRSNQIRHSSHSSAAALAEIEPQAVVSAVDVLYNEKLDSLSVRLSSSLKTEQKSSSKASPSKQSPIILNPDDNVYKHTTPILSSSTPKKKDSEHLDNSIKCKSPNFDFVSTTEHFYLNNSPGSFDFEEQFNPVELRKKSLGRKSCARKRESVALTESDSSKITSVPSSANASAEIIVSESEECDSSVLDSASVERSSEFHVKKSLSIYSNSGVSEDRGSSPNYGKSFISKNSEIENMAASIQSLSVDEQEKSNILQFNASSVKSNASMSKYSSKKSEGNTPVNKVLFPNLTQSATPDNEKSRNKIYSPQVSQESPKRITPLKVNSIESPVRTPFQEAVACSAELSFNDKIAETTNSIKKQQNNTNSNLLTNVYSSDDHTDNDSPIKTKKKNYKQRISSSSEGDSFSNVSEYNSSVKSGKNKSNTVCSDSTDSISDTESESNYKNNAHNSGVSNTVQDETINSVSSFTEDSVDSDSDSTDDY